MKYSLIIKYILVVLTYPLWFVFTAVLSGLCDRYYFSDTILGYIVVNMQWLLIMLFIAFIATIQYFIYKLKPMEKTTQKKIYVNFCVVIDFIAFTRNIVIPLIIMSNT